MRHFILFLCLVGGIAMAAKPTCRLQQTIIRAPEGEVLELMARGTHSDAEVSAQLHQWLREGRAGMLSDLSALRMFPDKVVAREGTDFMWWTEEDQILDAPTALYPMNSASFFVGSVMEYDSDNQKWKGSFSPRKPLLVYWPAVWTRQAAPKLDSVAQLDRFEQSISNKVMVPLSGPEVLAVFRPADRFEQPANAPRWLDVMEIATETEEHDLAAAQPPHQRVVAMGFAVPDEWADELLALHRDGGDDRILNRLLDEVKAQRAVLAMFGVQRVQGDSNPRMSSHREHAFPAEMPTFPSAWSAILVGDELNVSGAGSSGLIEVSMRSDLLQPPNATFPLALHRPELVMFWPEPVTAGFRAWLKVPDHGAGLAGIMRVPDYVPLPREMSDRRTMVFIVRNDLQGKPSPPPQWKFEGLEYETLVYEIDAADAAKYQDKSPFRDDGALLAKLQKTTGEGKARLLSRIWSVGDVHASQERGYVAETDGRDEAYPQQYRPTAIMQVFVGTDFNASLVPVAEHSNDKVQQFSGELTLSHHLAQPRIATLEEQLASLCEIAERPCRQRFHELKWTWKKDPATGHLTMATGKPYCLGVQHASGPDGVSKCHVAFVWVRPVK
ncbi:MAG: hypothetical protein JWO89_469 [Verrucomicrobiaceae bacterium]|nr:hypothetical protein [Verrucomicrobiaceae bacterium]